MKCIYALLFSLCKLFLTTGKRFFRCAGWLEASTNIKVTCSWPMDRIPFISSNSERGQKAVKSVPALCKELIGIVLSPSTFWAHLIY